MPDRRRKTEEEYLDELARVYTPSWLDDGIDEDDEEKQPKHVTKFRQALPGETVTRLYRKRGTYKTAQDLIHDLDDAEIKHAFYGELKKEAS